MKKRPIRFLVRLPGYNRFHYTPRYYDPEKEDLNRRVRMAKTEAGNPETEEADKMRQQFSGMLLNRHQYARIHHQKVMSRIRFLIILNLLLIVALYIFVKLL